MPSLSTSETVSSEAKSSSANSFGLDTGFASGAGSRGFVNNVNMNGKQVNDQPAFNSSPSIADTLLPLGILAVAAFVVIKLRN